MSAISDLYVGVEVRDNRVDSGAWCVPMRPSDYTLSIVGVAHVVPRQTTQPVQFTIQCENVPDTGLPYFTVLETNCQATIVLIQVEGKVLSTFNKGYELFAFLAELVNSFD